MKFASRKEPTGGRAARGAALLAVLAVGATAAVVEPDPGSLLRHKRVLVLEGPATGHEDAKTAARAKLARIRDTLIARAPGFVMTIRQGSVANITLDTLNLYDVLVFNYFFETEKTPAAFQSAVKTWLQAGNGRGWVGYHTSGANSEGEWDWYRDSVTAFRYRVHATGSALAGTVYASPDTNIRKLPVMRGLDSTFRNSDEWYDFDYSPVWGDSSNMNRNAKVRVLHYLDEKSVSGTLPKPMNPHPVTWTRVDDRGARFFYSILIHSGSGAGTDFFHSLLLRGLEFAAGYTGSSSIAFNGRTLEGSEASFAPGGALRVVSAEPYALQVFSLRGERIFAARGDRGSATYAPAALAKRGLYVVRIASRGGTFRQKLMVP